MAQPAGAVEALDMLSAAMGYLGAADPAAMTAQAQAEGTVLSESMSGTIWGWIHKILPDCHDAAHQILISAARVGTTASCARSARPAR